MALSVTCSNCGNSVPAGDRFCGTCGNPITGSALISGEGARFDPWTELLQKLRSATLGEYEIKGELGRGGMAAVFLAYDLQLNRRVAIKVMLPGLAYGERMWDRFLAEARTAAKLDHPHIVYIHSVKEKDRFLYFVMKHIDGRSLDDLLAHFKAFPIPVAQTVLVEVAKGLEYAHREGVIHRDVKPANIMVDQKGSSIVMDFGIARATDTQHFTQTGATIGTPAYMSPEQCHGSETSAASDQYSLGILAYELFAGQPPFTGTPIELQIAHMQDSPEPLRHRRPDMSLELSGAVMRMLEKNPADRWPSLHALVPIFGRGLDVLEDAPRTELIRMVKSGTPRRKSFPATPLSPTPLGGSHNTPRVSYVSRPSSDTMPVHGIREEAALESNPAQEAATQLSEPRALAEIAVSSPASELMWSKEDGLLKAEDGSLKAEDGGLKPEGEVIASGRSMKATTIVSAAVVLAVVGALIVRGGKKTPSSPPEAAQPAVAVEAASTPPAPVPPSAGATNELPGDSTATGPAPARKAGARGKAPKEVAADAVALLQFTLPRPRATVGDTLIARLDATDDAGVPVTTAQITWTTSNAKVARFAGPAAIIAVGAGKATITVSAGSTTATRELTVVAKKR